MLGACSLSYRLARLLAVLLALCWLYGLMELDDANPAARHVLSFFSLDCRSSVAIASKEPLSTPKSAYILLGNKVSDCSS